MCGYLARVEAFVGRVKSGSISWMGENVLWRRFGKGSAGRIARHEGGTAALEFSLIAMPFMMLILAIIETTLVFVASSTLENGMSEVARRIKTGEVQVGEMSADGVRTILCESVSALLDCSGSLVIDVRQFDNFGTVTNDPVLDENGAFVLTPQFDPGTAGDIVLVRVFYKWPIMTPLIGDTLSNMEGGTRLLAAAAVFRNEPFGSILSGG